MGHEVRPCTCSLSLSLSLCLSLSVFRSLSLLPSISRCTWLFACGLSRSRVLICSPSLSLSLSPSRAGTNFFLACKDKDGVEVHIRVFKGFDGSFTHAASKKANGAALAYFSAE